MTLARTAGDLRHYQDKRMIITEQKEMPTLKVVKKAVKSLMRDLPPLSTIIKDAVEGLTAEEGSATLDSKQVEDTVRAIKEAVKESVAEAILEGAKEK